MIHFWRHTVTKWIIWNSVHVPHWPNGETIGSTRKHRQFHLLQRKNEYWIKKKATTTTAATTKIWFQSQVSNTFFIEHEMNEPQWNRHQKHSMNNNWTARNENKRHESKIENKKKANGQVMNVLPKWKKKIKKKKNIFFFVLIKVQWMRKSRKTKNFKSIFFFLWLSVPRLYFRCTHSLWSCFAFIEFFKKIYWMNVKQNALVVRSSSMLFDSNRNSMQKPIQKEKCATILFQAMTMWAVTKFKKQSYTDRDVDFCIFSESNSFRCQCWSR